MIRHISMFIFKDLPEKAENIAAVRSYLEKIPAMNQSIRDQQVYTTVPGPEPDLPEGASPLFGDLVQIIDFDTVKDAQDYPASKAHMDLVALSDPMLKHVAAMDFEV